MRVALWGLVGDSYECPFDMIDAPPSYGKIAQVSVSSACKFELSSSVCSSLFSSLFCGLFLTLSFGPSANPPPQQGWGKEDSILVELLHVATKKGPLIALKVGGVALLYLLIRQVGLFIFWWAKFRIKRQTQATRQPPTSDHESDGQHTRITTESSLKGTSTATI
ncbi:unnamed protein product [Penicillium viridicatum]